MSALVSLQNGDTAVQITAKPDPLIVPQLVAHSADVDRNMRISLMELTRVIELYNTRNGTTRTGCYGVQIGTVHGRASTSDGAEAHQVVVRQRLRELAFTDDFVLESAQGHRLRMDAQGAGEFARTLALIDRHRPDSLYVVADDDEAHLGADAAAHLAERADHRVAAQQRHGLSRGELRAALDRPPVVLGSREGDESRVDSARAGCAPCPDACG